MSDSRATPIPYPEAGHFYAVGVGPGAPDLVTLRAARLLARVDVIVAPRSEKASESLALRCVAEHVGDAEIMEHVYPMNRDMEETRQSWDGVAARVAEACGAGKSVAQITIGDPLLYSTSAYLLEGVSTRLPAERIHVVPGIAAFQAAAARLDMPLTLQEDRMLLMTAHDLNAVAEALDRCETLVLYKVGLCVHELRDLLETKGVLEGARIVYYVEQPERETLVRDLRDLPADPPGYMATAIVRTGARTWDDLPAEERPTP